MNPPFLTVHIIPQFCERFKCGSLDLSVGLARFPRPNHAEGVYIINSARNCISSTRSVVYHQAAGEYTLKRDEIQPRRG